MTSDDDGEEVKGENGAKPPSARDDPRLGRIRDQLEGLKRNAQPTDRSPPGTGRGMAGINLMLRMGSEFIGGVVVGFVIGYTIDRLFGTTPWGMVAFLLIGTAAGTLNVMRAAGVVPEKFPVEPTADDRKRSGEDDDEEN